MKREKSYLPIDNHRSTYSLKRKSSLKLQESNPKAQRSLKVLNQGPDQDHLEVRKNNQRENDTSLTKPVLQINQYQVESQGKHHLIKKNHGEEVYFNIDNLSYKRQQLLLNYLGTKNETCFMMMARTRSKKAGPDKKLRPT